MSHLRSQPAWQTRAPNGRDVAHDDEHCAALMRSGSRSFDLAANLLPSRTRTDARTLYAFCRDADDSIDFAPMPGRSAALATLRRRLTAIFAGMPEAIPVDRAFADLLQASEIARYWPEALLEGFAFDVTGRRYADLPALHEYTARVAGSVGAMMAQIMGSRDAAVIGAACTLGMAMQLTNIARDVGEDARAGRLYIPLEWLDEARVTPMAFLQAPSCTPAMRRVIARLLREADRLYAAATPAIAHLPPRCRPAIAAARRLYQEIGAVTAHPHFDPVRRRAVVGPMRKAACLVRALADCAMPAQKLRADHPVVVAAMLRSAGIMPHGPLARVCETPVPVKPDRRSRIIGGTGAPAHAP